MTSAEVADDGWVEGVAARAAALIRSFQDVSGAYPASPTFSAYRGYSWFRDGAFIADAMSAAAEVESAHAFHAWCARALVAWRERVDAFVVGTPGDRDYSFALPARLRLDGSEGSAEWANHQVDGIGTWLWSLGEHIKRTDSDPLRWRAGVEVAVDYLCAVGQEPCFDWWEEEPMGVHPSTLACVAAGLVAVSGMGVLDPAREMAIRTEAEAIMRRIVDSASGLGYVPKTEGSAAIDAAIIAGVGPLGVIRGGLGLGTLETVESRLVDGEAVYRFSADRYYGGGPWPLLSAMLGLAWLEYGDRERARELLEWAASTEDIRGWIPEQARGKLLHPEGLVEWERRWGKSATPLLWSSAMVLRLTVALR